MRVLIFEDEPHHQQEAAAACVEAEVEYAIFDKAMDWEVFSLVEGCYFEPVAGEVKEGVGFDGVITDLFLPYKDYSDEMPNGLIVAGKCLAMNIPCVVCTSRWHHCSHRTHAHWAFDIVTAMNPRVKMVDCGEKALKELGRYEDVVDKETPHKRWQDAIEQLRQLVEEHPKPLAR